MAESSKWAFDSIWEKFSDLTEKLSNLWTKIKEIFDYIYKLFKWEVDNTVVESQWEINEVAADLIDKNLDITDEKISAEELEILRKIVELEGRDKNIESWLNWLKKDDNSGEFYEWAVNDINWLLARLQTESHDDSEEENTPDLNEGEFLAIADYAGKKYKVCNDVFQLAQSGDEKFKDLSDKFKTKEEIVASCNKVLEKNGWDIDLVTVDLIVQDLQDKQTEENSQNLA